MAARSLVAHLRSSAADLPAVPARARVLPSLRGYAIFSQVTFLPHTLFTNSLA